MKKMQRKEGKDGRNRKKFTGREESKRKGASGGRKKEERNREKFTGRDGSKREGAIVWK